MILMSNGADVKNNNNNNDTAIWTTWEELLLAFAVKRHGLDDWETVAMELQNRHRSSSVFTPENCRDKYKTLRRRFESQEANIHNNASAAAAAGSDSDGDNGFGESFAWLEELRKLRVAELKQEVQRYDLSIESLQKKAKTLEEERKSSNENSISIPDLDNNQIKEERSENDKTAAGQVDTPCATGKTVSCEDENRSCHESNSTENRQAGLKAEPELEGGIKQEPESLNPPVEDEEDSCDDSSDRRHELIGKESHEVVVNEEDDTAELAADSKEGSQGTKETSDVQSSASLLMTRKYRAVELDGGGRGGGNATTVVDIKRERQGAAVESEPLFAVLDNIWSQKHGSMFGHRLESQKTERYKKMIRQHVDLETVQSRIEDGLYSSCPAKFYVDLLLLVNNANVFFPKSSPESFAAHELRRLVMKQLKNSSAPPSSSDQPSSPRPQTKPDPGKSDSLLAKHKSTTPLIVCKKRSSISGKASSSSGNNNKAEVQDEDKPSSIPKPSVKSPLISTSNEEDGASKIKAKEKPVTTGVRSMRRGSSSKGRASVSSSVSGPIEKPISRSMPPLDNTTTDKAEASKVDKKKGGPEVASSSSTVKKKGAADFLKRIKKNEPGKGISPESVKYSGESSSKVKMDNKDHNPIKKSDEKKDVRRSGGGSSGGGGSNNKKKNVKEDISPSKRIGRPPKKCKEVVVMGKRGREGEGEGSSKQPKKKSRR